MFVHFLFSYFIWVYHSNISFYLSNPSVHRKRKRTNMGRIKRTNLTTPICVCACVRVRARACTRHGECHWVTLSVQSVTVSECVYVCVPMVPCGWGKRRCLL
jgi:hypothetical protein